MLFSILIPVYNTSNYLEECIQSVLAQTEKDFEIVLIDDGSTDESGRICDCYAKAYPELIRVIHKDNEGLLMTRRRGFREAQGEYFVCLDSDDYLFDNAALAKIKKVITNNKCDLVLYNYLKEGKNSSNNECVQLFDKPNGYVFFGEEKQLIYEKFLIGGVLYSLFIKVPKRSIVDIETDYSLWDKDLFKSQGEDLFQSMPILTNAERIGYVKDTLYFYRWNSGSISRNLQLNYYFAYKTMYQREDEFIPVWKVSSKVVQKNKTGRANKIISIIIQCYYSEKRTDWLHFIDYVSNDTFFVSLFNGNNKKDILLYYRILAFFIRHKQKLLLQLCIRTVSFISSKKKKKKVKNV